MTILTKPLLYACDLSSQIGGLLIGKDPMSKKLKTHSGHLVVKSNRLIEARYKLTVLEQKLVLTLVSKIQPDDRDFKTYTFRIIDLAKDFEIDQKRAYHELAKLTYDIMKKPLEIYSDEKKERLHVNWFSSAKHLETTGLIEFKISDEMKPYLLQLKEQFKAYPLQTVMQFKHIYSFRLYELLKQYEIPGERKIELAELKRILMLDENEYERLFNLEKRVLKPVIAEINAKSDLAVTYEKVKFGRKVTGISFRIEPASEADLFASKLSKEQQNLLRRGMKAGIRKMIVLGYLKEYSVEKVSNGIKVVESSKNPENANGLFVESIKKGWQPTLRQGEFLNI